MQVHSVSCRVARLLRLDQQCIDLYVIVITSSKQGTVCYCLTCDPTYMNYIGQDQDEVIFTASELELFQQRCDEGYDIPPSGRYLLWLQMYGPELVQQGIVTCVVITFVQYSLKASNTHVKPSCAVIPPTLKSNRVA